MRVIKLGLIGDNIHASRAPDLHRIAGEIAGLSISYERIVPPERGMGFEAAFADALVRLDGFNVTLPYKEKAAARLRIPDPFIRRLGAVNTVIPGAQGPEGHNTDFTGFLAAWAEGFGDRSPGRTVLFGAGGAGKAVALALVRLGAAEIVVIDPDAEKADGLARAVTALGTTARMGSAPDLAQADGVANCTPLGMAGHPGSPLPEDVALPRGLWAFDAVYTPIETPFRARALAAGVAFLSGWELFFHQGLDAFRLFTGQPVADPARLRAMLAAPAD